MYWDPEFEGQDETPRFLENWEARWSPGPRFWTHDTGGQDEFVGLADSPNTPQTNGFGPEVIGQIPDAYAELIADRVVQLILTRLEQAGFSFTEAEALAAAFGVNQSHVSEDPAPSATNGGAADVVTNEAANSGWVAHIVDDASPNAATSGWAVSVLDARPSLEPSVEFASILRQHAFYDERDLLNGAANLTVVDNPSGQSRDVGALQSASTASIQAALHSGGSMDNAAYDAEPWLIGAGVEDFVGDFIYAEKAGFIDEVLSPAEPDSLAESIDFLIETGLLGGGFDADGDLYGRDAELSDSIWSHDPSPTAPDDYGI